MSLIGGIELVCTTSLLIKNELFAIPAIAEMDQFKSNWLSERFTAI